MIETYIEAVTTIRECRERKVRDDDYTTGLDSLIDTGQGAEFRAGLGIVNDDGTVDLRAAEALALGKGNRILYISARKN